MDATSPTGVMLFTTVRIESKLPTGTGYGTGFMVRHDISATQGGYFLVSNRHVFMDAESIRFFLFRSDGDGPALGNKMDVDISGFSGAWTPHPDPDVDIAVFPVTQTMQAVNEQLGTPHFNYLGTHHFPDDDEAALRDPVQDVVFVGYPIGIYDRVNLLPLVRQGITATPPSVDYEGRPEFLLDAAVFPGSSGSPVFAVHSAGVEVTNAAGVRQRRAFTFLGLVSKRMTMTAQGDITIEDAPVVKKPVANYTEPLNLGVVVKARMVLETIQAALRDDSL